MKDHYATLGLEPDCEHEAVKQSFRRLAQQLHPDVGGDERAFRELKEAYEVLGDPALREAYDLQYVVAFPGYALVDADTGEELEVEWEDEPNPPQAVHRQQDNGWGLFWLVAIMLPALAFGFMMAWQGDPVTASIVAGFLLLAAVAVGALVKERM